MRISIKEVYSEHIKGYRVWNIESKRIEITRSASFQELPENKYVNVILDDTNTKVQKNQNCEHCEEAESIHNITPEVAEFGEEGSMDFDEELTSIPDVEIFQNSTDITSRSRIGQGIVPSGRLNSSDVSSLFSSFMTNALPPSENFRAIVSYKTSSAIVAVETQYNRPSKRYILEYEQENAAIEAPSSYKEAITCEDSKDGNLQSMKS